MEELRKKIVELKNKKNNINEVKENEKIKENI